MSIVARFTCCICRRDTNPNGGRFDDLGFFVCFDCDPASIGIGTEDGQT